MSGGGGTTGDDRSAVRSEAGAPGAGDADPARRRPRLRRPGRRDVLRAVPYVLLVLVGLVAGCVHIARYTEFSPIDELRHLDYAMRAGSGQVPRFGDLLIQPAMREEACRGLELQWDDPPCRSRSFDPVAFRDNGYQIASIHPPTYYVATGLFARTAKFLGLSDTFVDPARVWSALLLGIGLAVAFAAGRVMGIRRSPLFAVLVMVPVVPAVLHSASTVNPDSTAILVGAVVLLGAVLWERGRLPLWSLAVIGVVSTGVKFTSILAVLVMAGVFVVRADPVGWWRRRRTASGDGGIATAAGVADPDGDPAPMRTSREYLLGTALMLGPAVAVALVWSVIDKVRAVVAPDVIPQIVQSKAHGMPPLSYFLNVNQVFAWFPPVNGYDTPRFVTVYTQDARVLLTYLFAGALLVGALRFARRDEISLMAGFVALIGLVGGPLYVALNVGVQGILLDLPARYGLSLFPFIVVVVASFARRRVGTAVLWVIAVPAYVVTILAMLQH